MRRNDFHTGRLDGALDATSESPTDCSSTAKDDDWQTGRLICFDWSMIFLQCYNVGAVGILIKWI